MPNSFRNITRLIQILRVFAKHDALFFVEKINIFPIIKTIAKICTPLSLKSDLNNGERLANAFVELGPTFIKLGQALSIRADIIGEEIANDLSNLQDNLPPFDSSEAVNIIEQELGDKVENIFKTFDKSPVAAASIAQVHFAENLEGEKLAIKVLRPNIEKKFEKDINLLYWIADNVNRKMPKYRRLKLTEIVKSFEEISKLEMDFSFEAAAASELAENFKGDSDIRIPKVYWQQTTSKVLTIERFEGVQIDDLEGLKKEKIDVNEILRKSANIFMKQVLRDGFFHADMHPGNLIIDKNGKICVFDFGIMGRIDRKTKIFLADMLLGFLNGDYNKVSDVHFEAGYIPNNQSRELFAQACRSIGEPILGLPQKDISIARLLQNLFKITEKFNMETQPQLLLLQKTMMMAEGISRKLNPEVNFWELSRELIEDWGNDNLGVKARIEDKFIEATTTFGKLSQAANNLNSIITNKGILIHPETVEALQARRKGGFIKGFLFASILAVIVYNLMLWQIF